MAQLSSGMLNFIREGGIGKGFLVRGVSRGNLQHPYFKFLACMSKLFYIFEQKLTII
jgi:hypothetical protein